MKRKGLQKKRRAKSKFYSIIFLGTGGGTRTHGQEIKSLLLYQLSYAGSQAKLLKVSVFKLWSRRMLFRNLYIFLLLCHWLNGESLLIRLQYRPFLLLPEILKPESWELLFNQNSLQ